MLCAIDYPLAASIETKRMILLGHLMETHDITPPDIAGSHSFESLQLLHATLEELEDLPEQSIGEPDEVDDEYDIRSEQDRSMVSLIITEQEDIWTYSLSPTEAFDLGSSLIKNAAVAFGDSKITATLFGGLLR